MKPICVQQLRVALGQDGCPLASVLARGVLPLWLHALLEQVEVRHVREPRRRDDVVVQAPEVLDGVKRVDGTERLSPLRLGLLLLSVRVIEPQRPLGFERVLLREIRLRRRAYQWTGSEREYWVVVAFPGLNRSDAEIEENDQNIPRRSTSLPFKPSKPIMAYQDAAGRSHCHCKSSHRAVSSRDKLDAETGNFVASGPRQRTLHRIGSNLCHIYVSVPFRVMR